MDEASPGADGPPIRGATQAQAREFAQAFRSFLEWVHSDSARGERNEVAALISDFLGTEGSAHSVVTRELASFEHVNLQTALDAWQVEAGREVTIHGIAIPPHHGGVSLQQFVMGEGIGYVRLSAPPLTDLPNGPDSMLACLHLAALLVGDERGRYAIMVSGPGEHDPSLTVEVAGLPVAAAQAVHAELDRLRSRLNVYRGQLLDVEITPMGGVSLQFTRLAGTARDEVILPEVVLGRIERHALSVAEHREALLRAGQHLKRGLLLYGPPGTGKTHTTRYLVGQMPGYTRFLLTGRSLNAIGSVAELARDLQPSVVVLEDVDLVAEDRSFGPGSSPVLFDLLDAMDGAAPDADLLFVLTTNRADLLEPALAARPGRVDVAVEIDLPDADARARLLALYGRSIAVGLSESERAEIVVRTDGVTASFIKELSRRAILEALQEGGEESGVTAAHIARALDDLLDTGQQLTRSLLGVGNDPESVSPGGGVGSLPAPRGRAWVGYGPRRFGPQHFGL
jgi:ATPase family associated with various cellular activities (AAA)